MLGRFRAKLLLRRNKKRAIIQLRLLFSLIHSLLCVPVYHGGKGARLTTNEFSQKKERRNKGKELFFFFRLPLLFLLLLFRGFLGFESRGGGGGIAKGEGR